MTTPTPADEPARARYWADLTTLDFAQLNPATTVAVLPVAATEQHGPHLPLSVDTALVDGVIAAALPQLRQAGPDAPQASVLVLPTQAVGLSPEHMAFAGTLSLSPQTLISLWTEIGACVARAGVKKLVLFNAHGGQVSAMDIVARELRLHHGLIVYSSSWYGLPLGDEVNGLFSADEHRFGVHAGEIETSMMLALRPQDVRMDVADAFPSTSRHRAAHFPILGNGRSARLGWAMQDYNPQGAAGNAAAATADKGRALIDAAARQLALMLLEVARLPLDTARDL
ncbi:MAG: creatininase family protein [Burkholderiaceae bacterium]|nr:creatininase family protein [Burkholderiaceae bacterium]